MGNPPMTVVVGIGNDFRRDDGVGLYVARLVREISIESIKIVIGIPDGYALMETWSVSSKVYVIDSTVSGALPGYIYRFDALRENIPTDIFTGYSTHSINLVQAIELARTMNRLPDSLIIYGIEGGDFSPGPQLSPEVERAARATSECIVNELKKSKK